MESLARYLWTPRYSVALPSIAIQRKIGDRYRLAESLHTRGNIALDRQEYASAHADYRESLTLRQTLNDLRGVAYSLESLAALAWVWWVPSGDDAERAVQLFSAGAALREAIGVPLSPFDRLRAEQTLAALRAALSDEAYAAAWIAGQSLTPEQAIAYALDERPS